MTFKPFVGDDFRATFSIFNKAEQIRLFLNPPALSFPPVLTNQKNPLCVCVSPPPFLAHRNESVAAVSSTLATSCSATPPIQECCHGGVGTGQGPDAPRAGTGCGTVPDPMPPIPSPSSCAHLSCCPLPGHHLPPKPTPVLPQAWPHVDLGTETRHQFTRAGWELGALVSQG